MHRMHGIILPVLGVITALCLAGVPAQSGSDEAPPPPPEPAPRDTPAQAEAGDRVLVVFTDGHRVEGEFIRKEPRRVFVKIANVETEFDLADVSALVPLSSPLSEFRRMRGLIKDSDVERRIDLALWARDRALYRPALDEVTDILKRDPGSVDAIRLKNELEKLIQLQDKSAAKPPDASGAQDSPKPPRRPGLGEFPLLSESQINVIKVYETDLRHPPKLVIPRETIDRLLTRYTDSPLIPSTREGRDAFRLLPPEQILEVMFRVRARELYPEVRVLDSPPSMKKFRDQVHSAWIVNNCATTRCHGGSAAGRLLLTNRRPTSEASFYTNFLILDRFRTSDQRPMINWADPEKSVLLQMGLPRDDASVPHPVVKGWTPMFRSREDRRFQQAVEWMRMMYRPRPDYPVTYDPPGQARDRDSDLPAGER